MRETLREFMDRTDRETWTGLSTAFRAGVKSRLYPDRPLRYGRQDFQAAWFRGVNAIEEHLAAGNVVTMPSEDSVEAKLLPVPGRSHESREKTTA